MASSWLPRSIADSLRIDDDEDGDDNHNDEQNDENTPSQGEEEEEEDRGRGVREDLSEFGQTLSRQLWGVASYLAPPPPLPPPPPPRYRHVDRWEPHDQSCSGSGAAPQDDSGGTMSNQTRFTRYYEDEEDAMGYAVGVTEEVLAFAMNIAHHPETWLDFPLEEEEDIDDLDMSDAQHKHSLAIQRLAPRLAALRIELCPAHMSDGYFWKVYFVLLYSRLNKQDADLLSTPQIVAARAIWMQELQKRTKKETDLFVRGASDFKDGDTRWNESYEQVLSSNPTRSIRFGPITYSTTTEHETEKHTIADADMQIVDKAVIKEETLTENERMSNLRTGPSFKFFSHSYEDDDEDDDWLNEDSELEGYNTTAIIMGNDDDVSFSDLEDDDDCTMPIKSKIVTVDLATPLKASQT